MMTEEQQALINAVLPETCEDSRTIHVRVYPASRGNWCVAIERFSDRMVIEGRYHDVLSRAGRILEAMEPYAHE